MSMIKDLLKNVIKNNAVQINEWFNNKYKSVNPCFYSSVDLRHSGNKLAPVDTNLFPAGFNNIGKLGKRLAGDKIKDFLKEFYPEVQNILLIAESHTRNLFYLENVIVIKELLESTGCNIKVAMLDDIQEEKLLSASGKELSVTKLIKENNLLKDQEGFIPELIILNNDLTSGIPQILHDIKQAIIPSPKLGWHNRRKSMHFEVYNQLVNEFCSIFPVDPFLISTAFHRCGTVNFKEKQGLECVALGVEKLLHNLRSKYQQYGINDRPYAFVKADNGTYGMGIMTVTSGEEVYEMNKKLRNKMDVIRGGILNNEVIIQEGIRTIDKIEGNVSEPMIYLVKGEPVSCFFRVNGLRDEYGNLNAQGMQFEKNICEEKDLNHNHNSDEVCDFTILSLIAKLASLAAALE